MQSRPLANNFAPGSGIFNFIVGHTRKLICGGVANTVAAGLNSVHFNAGQLCQNIRHLFQLGPVKLNILSGSEVHIALVVAARDMSQFANLLAAQKAIGHSYA